MTTLLPPWPVLDPLLLGWLQEDWGRGDWTTQGLFPGDSPQVTAEILLKEDGLICGLPIVARIFKLADASISFIPLVAEGSRCHNRTIVARLEGDAVPILMAERVALNILQRLSGISTLTERYVAQLVGSPCQLTDTRKTTPGLRILEKYAVRVGGAINHRLGLDDAVLVKDNHISAAGSITQAVKRIREHLPHLISIEVECELLAQVQEAYELGITMILLDNMTPAQLQASVQWIAGRLPLEASGNITLDNLAEVAKTGVNFIATSAPMTRSRWLDISLNFNE